MYTCSCSRWWVSCRASVVIGFWLVPYLAIASWGVVCVQPALKQPCLFYITVVSIPTCMYVMAYIATSNSHVLYVLLLYTFSLCCCPDAGVLVVLLYITHCYKGSHTLPVRSVCCNVFSNQTTVSSCLCVGDPVVNNPLVYRAWCGITVVLPLVCVFDPMFDPV